MAGHSAGHNIPLESWPLLRIDQPFCTHYYRSPLHSSPHLLHKRQGRQNALGRESHRFLLSAPCIVGVVCSPSHLRTMGTRPRPHRHHPRHSSLGSYVKLNTQDSDSHECLLLRCDKLLLHHSRNSNPSRGDI